MMITNVKFFFFLLDHIKKLWYKRLVTWISTWFWVVFEIYSTGSKKFEKKMFFLAIFEEFEVYLRHKEFKSQSRSSTHSHMYPCMYNYWLSTHVTQQDVSKSFNFEKIGIKIIKAL